MIRSGDGSTRLIGGPGRAVLTALFLLLPAPTTAASAPVTDSIRFFILDWFLDGPRLTDTSVVRDPFARAAAVCAEYYGLSADSTSEFAGLTDPLRIPNPFRAQLDHSADLFAQATARFAAGRLAYTVAFPASFTEAEQSVADAIVGGSPVLAIHPRPLLLFGYDYREPDPFWYAVRFSPTPEVEITTRSQWRAEWWLWDEDPAAVTLLPVTGPDTSTRESPMPERVLEKVLLAAKTDTAAGVTSYIRPILDIQDTLAKAPTPPQVVGAQDPSDPLNLHDAGAKRVQFERYLRSLLPLARDTIVGQQLRLAIFSAGKAAEEFTAAAREIYGEHVSVGAADSTTVTDRIAARWVEHRLEAAKHLAEAVRWERQMLAAIKDITETKKPFRR